LATAVQIIIETKSAPAEGSIDYLPLVEVVVHDLLHRPGEHDVAQIPLLLRHIAAAVLPHPARGLFTRSLKDEQAAFAVAGKGWERRTRGVASSESEGDATAAQWKAGAVSSEVLRLTSLVVLYFHPLYMLVIEILSSIYVSSVPIILYLILYNQLPTAAPLVISINFIKYIHVKSYFKGLIQINSIVYLEFNLVF
jgi:hypothetical protein